MKRKCHSCNLLFTPKEHHIIRCDDCQSGKPRRPIEEIIQERIKARREQARPQKVVKADTKEVKRVNGTRVSVNKCFICGAEFITRRKDKSICHSYECYKARARIYNNTRRGKGKKNHEKD